MIGIVRDARIVRVEVRLRHHRDDLAGVHVGDDTGCGLRLEFIARRHQLFPQRVLRAQVDCQIDRTLQLIGCKPRHVQCGEALPIQPLLDTGDALVVDVHVADLVRHDRHRLDRHACSRSGSRHPGSRADESRAAGWV